ncbi:hypothetical protein N786_08230 [Bacillus amyloliquefaciens UASWS BA1]|nr:hypothetical protein N786_08230 [Bacillus amyloliquefaciens UASWS BA1]
MPSGLTGASFFLLFYPFCHSFYLFVNGKINVFVY